MGKLKAGAVKKCITPTADFYPMTGFMGMRGAEEVLHDLYIRIVVLENEYTRFLFLNIDSGPSPDAQKRKCILNYQIPHAPFMAISGVNLEFERQFYLPAKINKIFKVLSVMILVSIPDKQLRQIFFLSLLYCFLQNPPGTVIQ